MTVIFVIIAFLVVIRFVLPYFALFVINKKLAKFNGYVGRINDLSLSFIKGTLRLGNIRVNKKDLQSVEERDFLNVGAILISFRWLPLIQKSFIGQIVIDDLQLYFVKQPSNDLDEHTPVNSDSTEQVSQLKRILQGVPCFNTSIEIHNGTIRYVDNYTKPRVDVVLHDLHVSINNFSNIESTTAIPTILQARGNVNEGVLDFNMTLFPLADQITFDLNLELKDTNMVLLNDFFRAYARIDVNHGTFGMYVEIGASDGYFKGYVKPVFKDLDIIGAEDKNDNLFRKLWERLVAGIVQVLENNKDNQITTIIPLEGKLNDPRINIFSAVGGILQNAFTKAIQPSFDNAINISTVVKSASNGAKGFIKKIFIKNESLHN